MLPEGLLLAGDACFAAAVEDVATIWSHSCNSSSPQMLTPTTIEAPPDDSE